MIQISKDQFNFIQLVTTFKMSSKFSLNLCIGDLIHFSKTSSKLENELDFLLLTVLRLLHTMM
eukprot:14429.XXX_398623_398811_1 [CDS] Oithona nana genome sequencing.